MNPEIPRTPREEMELRLTALLLGELSGDDAAAVREAIAKDPELTKLHDDLKQTIHLVREATTSAAEPASAETTQPKLADARRKQLLTAFAIPPLKESDRKPKRLFQLGLVEALAVLAIIGVLAAMLFPAVNVTKSMRGTFSQSDAISTESLARRTWGLKQEAATESPSPAAQAQSPSNFDAVNVVGYYNVDLSKGQPVAVASLGGSPRLSALPASAGTVVGKGKVDSATLAKPIGQASSSDQTVVATIAPAAPPAPAQPRPQIVLQGLMDKDANGIVSGGSFQQNQDVGSVALFGGEPAAEPFRERYGGLARLPVAGATVPQDQLAGTSGSVRGWADGSGREAVPSFDVTTEGDKRLSDSSVVGDEREGLAFRGAASITTNSVGAGDLAFGAFKSDEFGRGRSGGVENKPELTNLAPSATPRESYRFSGGGGVSNWQAGVAGSPVTLTQHAQSDVSEERVTVLGDLPTVGKLFQSAPEDSGRRGRVVPVHPPSSEPPTLGAFVAADSAAKPYFEKKRELEELQQFARILETKQATERVDVALPKTPMVDIIDRATPAREKTGFWRSLGAPVGGAFASTARVKVEPDVSDIQGLQQETHMNPGYDPYFIQTEFDAIQSEQVLGKVVDSLGLDQAWAKNGRKLNKAEAVAQLKAKLDLKPSRNTSLVEIRATDADANEAAKIANAVAETYTAHRLQERMRLTSGGIKILEERYQEQQQKIAGVQKEVDRLRTELKISDSDAGGTARHPNVPAAVAPAVEPDAPPIRKPSTNAPIPQPEIQTSENAYSTFSLNVSDVSFKLAAASLEKGQMPDAASVRSEEFINAFNYRDPEAAPGAPIAFAWERARYPFAHNRDLLRFSLKTAAAGRQAGRPLNLVLLLDNSGSMERADRVSIIREALRVLASQLQPQDKFSVITFARTARLVADGISGDKAGEVAEQVSGLTPQGGTNLEDAMNLAYQTAAKHYLANGINRVVLLTDGAANLGNVEPESLKQKVEAQRQQGIALDCFGIGWEGFNDDLLEVLSRNGDGRYGFINSPEEAATDFVSQLAGALQVAASDVKVQVEFNPKRVTTYRQIGYAKHQLTKEQFRDNSVDAAEIAAQEAGNALYTVEVNPAGEGPLGTVRVRYKIPGTADYREQAWDVPFTGNAASLEQASAAMRLAMSASAFSEWLVASPFAGEVTPDRVLGFLSGVPETYGADARPKKLEWMIRQAKSLEGK